MALVCVGMSACGGQSAEQKLASEWRRPNAAVADGSRDHTSPRQRLGDSLMRNEPAVEMLRRDRSDVSRLLGPPDRREAGGHDWIYVTRRQTRTSAATGACQVELIVTFSGDRVHSMEQGGAPCPLTT